MSPARKIASLPELLEGVRLVASAVTWEQRTEAKTCTGATHWQSESWFARLDRVNRLATYMRSHPEDFRAVRVWNCEEEPP